MSELWTPDLDAQVTPEKVEKPASRWRNKWRNRQAGTCFFTGERVAPGERFGPRVFASKDIAETTAAEDMAFNADSCTLPPIYLGAFPEGDA